MDFMSDRFTKYFIYGMMILTTVLVAMILWPMCQASG